MTKEIYIPLLDEGTDVWRPTQGEVLSNDIYLVRPSPDYDSEDEVWKFPPGSEVICEIRKLSAGEVLAAVRLAKVGKQTA